LFTVRQWGVEKIFHRFLKEFHDVQGVEGRSQRFP